MDYHTPDPLPKGYRDCFSDNIQASVHIGIDNPLAVCCLKQSTPDAFSHIAFTMSYRLGIQKAAFARVALVDRAYFDADQFRLVLKHRDKPGVRHLHEVLVIPPSDGDLLLPAIVFADDQHTDAFMHQHVNDASAVGMQVVRDLAVAPVRDALHQAGAALPATLGLKLCRALVVELIDMLLTDDR